MKRPLAAILTLVLMAALLWAGVGRAPRDPPAQTSTASRPADSSLADHPAVARVRALLESSDGGNVDQYLVNFTGVLRARLDRKVGERGRGEFADDLKRAAESRKSHAVFAAVADGTAAARVVVESVFVDRNERQTYLLERQESGDWLVSEVETIRSAVPEAKYGAPAAFLAPEGVPVQGSAPGVNVETGDEPASRQEPGPRDSTTRIDYFQ